MNEQPTQEQLDLKDWTIPAGKVEGDPKTVHALEPNQTRSLWTRCELPVFPEDVLLFLQPPQAITCPVCRRAFEGG